jgi:hypothetical protein
MNCTQNLGYLYGSKANSFPLWSSSWWSLRNASPPVSGYKTWKLPRLCSAVKQKAAIQIYSLQNLKNSFPHMCKKNKDNSCDIYELTFEELESSGSGSKCINCNDQLQK